ncbi:bifunctional DNA primase/polymerase [Microbacterium sp. J1-1]|uniref:bifunctional DNA primase/polymerase n=1 Tax=Microbacterium sp. J1-1 TaxID=2992441 RepID=UPI0021140894|nr:bifunctional DNA primase/polymerase [Microbacterium sp. J1-1]UUE19383.1 bifunctional DNA primase/polymerase [Microbacterium sp. J1-1]
MSVASVLAALDQSSLQQAAARLADAGVPVFPCVPGEKRPLISHGFHEATPDPSQVAAWWRRWPSANIGIPTGSASGVDVVDVDRKPGGNGFDAFGPARRAGLVDGWAAVVRTPSGGAHFYYPADPGRPQSSWQAAAAHVDFRGTGGYVIVPPSVVTTAHGPARYAIAAGADRAPGVVDAGRLRDFLNPRPAAAEHRVRGPLRSEDAKRLAAWVGMRAEGERNRGLFWASCRLAEAGLSLPEMVDALAPAGEQVGLPPREVVTTIRSAYRATHTHPEPSGREPGDAPRQMPRLAGRVLS